MSRIRTNIITNRMANGAPTVSNGLVISGITTSTTFSGSGASLTNIPSAQLTGALPALDGSNLTGLSGVSVANQSDNRLITATGTTDALNGEANLTFDGSSLDIFNGSNSSTIKLKRHASTLKFGGAVKAQASNTGVNITGSLTVNNAPISAGLFAGGATGIHSTSTVGIQTADVTSANLVGAATSMVGLYIGDGHLLFSNYLNKSGGYYITTGLNALNAGPVTLGTPMTLDGTWTIV